MESTSITATKDDEDKTSIHAQLEHKGEEKKQNDSEASESNITTHTGGRSISDNSRVSNITHETSWCSNSVTESPPVQMMARSEQGSEWSVLSNDSLFSIKIKNNFPKVVSLDAKTEESFETAESSERSSPKRPSPIKVTRGNYDMVANNRTKKFEDKITSTICAVDAAINDSKQESENSTIDSGTTTDDSNTSSTMPLKKKKRCSECCCCRSKFKLCCCKLPKFCQCKSLRIHDSCNWSLQCCSCKKLQCNCCHWPKCSSCKRLKCGSCCKWPSCSCLPCGPLSCSCLKSWSCCSSSFLKCPKGLSCSCLKSFSCCSCSTSCFKCSKGMSCSCFKGSSCGKCRSCNCFKQLSCSCFHSSCKWPSCSCLGSCTPSCGSCGWPSCCSCKWPGCSCLNTSRLRHWCSCFCCCKDKKADEAVQNSEVVQDTKQNSSSKGWFSCL